MKMNRIFLPFIFLFILSLGCRTESREQQIDYYASPLFVDVQMQGLFEDSKTFVDLIPKDSYYVLNKKYEKERRDENFDLKAFVAENFSDKSTATLTFTTDTTHTMYEHISSIWDKLTREPDSLVPYSSRISLPYEYIVPGGRFKEIYYWDSYFTMEGLLVDNQEHLARNMVDNFAYLIDTLGFIPNGTRNYYLSRSQPPFFTLMVTALARKDSTILGEYLPMIEKEYDFWMAGKDLIEEQYEANKYVVKVGDDSFLNRYWDSSITPRPESYKEDFHLAADLATEKEKTDLYANLRAGATSGWDFSSRWFAEEDSFESTNTANLLPVDLNCLLYFMEKQIAKGYSLKGNKQTQLQYSEKALKRKELIQKTFWDEDVQFFMDYDFKTNSNTDEFTLAATFPLFFNIATKEQAEAVKEKLITDFLKDGGLLTTLKNTGQQWDAPNGWAPLQWMAVHGLLNYGYEEEALDIMKRWLAINERVYKNTGKMMEKYNVEDTSLLSGGGEYETQDGFGWTNGVALGFKALMEQMETKKQIQETVNP
jgi:alpha,alpha-trehalase